MTHCPVYIHHSTQATNSLEPSKNNIAYQNPIRQLQSLQNGEECCETHQLKWRVKIYLGLGNMLQGIFQKIESIPSFHLLITRLKGSGKKLSMFPRSIDRELSESSSKKSRNLDKNPAIRMLMEHVLPSNYRQKRENAIICYWQTLRAQMSLCANKHTHSFKENTTTEV